MEKLQRSLEKMKIADEAQVEVSSVRKIMDGQLERRIDRDIQLDEFRNWIMSGYHYGEAIKSCYIGENEDEKCFADGLWKEVITRHNELEEKQNTCLNIHQIIEFCLFKKWFSPINDQNDYRNISKSIAEELEILSSEYTNDGRSNVPEGDTTVLVGENPEDILMKGLRGTFLQRFQFSGPDRDHPRKEFSENYFPMAFPFIFLSGDGCPFQDRPINIRDLNNWKQKYLQWLAKQLPIASNEQLVFVIYNLMRRVQSWDNSHIVLSNLKANDELPTRQDIVNQPSVRQWCANNLLRYNGKIIDSDPWWRDKKNELLGSMRHMAAQEEWNRQKDHPIIGNTFSTGAINYIHCPAIHNKFTNRYKNHDSPNSKVYWLEERKSMAIKHSWFIQWMGAFMAELDAFYLSKQIQEYDYFFVRFEWGKNSNPHSHRPSFSHRMGKMVKQDKQDIENKMKDWINEQNEFNKNDPQFQRQLQEYVESVWKTHRQNYANSISTMYTNWNYSRTSKGKLTNPNYKFDRNDLAALDVLQMMSKAVSGDTNKLDEVYNAIAQTCCRHQMHSGPPGKYGPSVTKKDYCAIPKIIVDREAMKKHFEKTGKTKVIKKTIYVCKRRYGQPLSDTPSVSRDPHKPQLTLASTEKNDSFFNGCSPWRVLALLANCDDKATVPGYYQRTPVLNYDEEEVSLVFFDADDGQSEYGIKYSCKGVLKRQQQSDILMAATEHLEPDESVVNSSIITRANNQYTLNKLTPLFNASHVIQQISLLVQNMFSRGVNISGVTTLRPDYDEATDGENYSKNNLKLFDDRLTRLSDESAKYREMVSVPMSTTEFFDTFTVSEIREVGGRKLKLAQRRTEPQNRSYYKGIHMTPNVTLKSMNPNDKFYWKTCQDIIFARKEFNTIAEELVRFSTEEEKKDYWIGEFEDQFPNGRGLPPHILRFYRHYHPEKNNPFPEIAEEDIEDEELVADCNRNEEEDEDDNVRKQTHKLSKDYFQTPEDMLRSKVITENNVDIDIEGENEARFPFNPPGHDFQHWLNNNVVNGDDLQRTYKRMTQTNGRYSLNNDVSTLNTEQLLFHNIIRDFIRRRRDFDRGVTSIEPEPLRLFLTGLPGTGKSHALKTTMCTLINHIGPD